MTSYHEITLLRETESREEESREVESREVEISANRCPPRYKERRHTLSCEAEVGQWGEAAGVSTCFGNGGPELNAACSGVLCSVCKACSGGPSSA